MEAKDLEAALMSEDFLASREVLVIPNATQLEGFSSAIDSASLDVPGGLNALMTGYPNKVTIRRHGADWKDRKQLVNGDQLEAMLLGDPGSHWNVLDVDSRKQPGTSFTIPDAVKAVSLNEILREDIHKICRADREGSYLLMSAPGAMTMFHQDMTGTCVFYMIPKGCKTFCIARPSEQNQGVYNEYLHGKRRDLFLGDTRASTSAGASRSSCDSARRCVCPPA